MNWKRVIDELPVIPEGRYGIQVLVAEFDACYDECINSQGFERNAYSVHSVGYSIIDYKRMPMFEGSIYPDGSETFTTMYIGAGKDAEFGPTGDIVTHWMYMPEPPEYDPEVLNPIFQRYHDHAVPQSPLKQLPIPDANKITSDEWEEIKNRT